MTHDYPEATPFVESADAMAQVDAALEAAAENDTRVLIVAGANWCHDSRALAGWLETDRFQALIEDRFELVFVDVGNPRGGEGRNLNIGQRFGHEQTGTPNLLVVTPDGRLINPASAGGWNNAASRSEDAIYVELLELADRNAEIRPVEGAEIAE